MASLVEELISVLKEEYVVYEQLLPIAMEKTRVIVVNDLNALQTITSQEQAAVDKIANFELKREQIMENIRTVIGKKANAANLSGLIQLMDKQPKEQKELSILRDNLHDAIRKLSEINNRNKVLIEQSLEMIEFNMNVIQSTRLSPGNNYTKGASAYDAPTVGTGLFDAKQ